MAAGKVCTGFSKPYVALYNNNAGTITYTNGMQLARGVSVSASADSADDNNFYADNIIAESETGVFTSGELTLTVDGLKQVAEKMIMGLPEEDAQGFMNYDDDQRVPDCGCGFVARYMSDGVTTYTPIIFTRVAFQFPGIDAATQEENIDWQTRDLTATVKRAEDAKRTWRKIGGDETTEAAAEDKIKAFLGITQNQNQNH